MSIEPRVGAVRVPSDITENKRAEEEALRVHEAQLRSFVLKSPMPIAMFDRNMNCLAVSRHWTSDFGGGHRDLIGLNHYDVHSDIPDRWKETHRKGLEGETQTKDEDLWLKADGSRTWMRWNVSPWLDATGKIGGILIMSENITARKEAEEALRESEKKYRDLFESSRDALMVGEYPSGRFISGNLAAVTIFGLKNEEELISHGPVDLSPERQPDGRLSSERAKELIEKAIRNGSHFFEWTHRRANGEEFFANVLLTRAERDGKPIFMATVRDITQQKLGEAFLRLQTSALEAAANSIIFTDGKGVIEWANPSFTTNTGYSVAEAIGKNPRFLKSGKHDEKFYRNLWKTISDGKIWHGEIINRRKDGTLYDEEMTITPIRDGRGKIEHFIAIKQDITKRKEIEEQLNWKTAVLEAQLNADIDGILIVDSKRQKVLQNQRMVDLWHFPPEWADEIGHQRRYDWIIRQIKSPKQFAEKAAYLYAHPDAVSHDEIELLDGRFIDRYSAPVRGQDGKYFGRLWSFRDVTKRKETEKVALRLAAIVNSSSDAIIGKDLNSIITSWNIGAKKIFGYLAEEVIGVPITRFMPSDRRQEELQIMERIRQGESVEDFESVRVAKDGRLVDLSMTVSPIKDKTGEIMGASTVARDITERKRLEKEVLNIRESERQRIGADLHDHLGQQLTAIEMRCQSLREKLHSRPSLDTQMGKICRFLQEAVAQTRQLARNLVPVSPDAGGLADSLAELARRMSQGPVPCDFICALPVEIRDNTIANYLFRIAQEAINNAMKHARARKVIVTLSRNKDTVLLRIQDDGKGFPKSKKAADGIGMRIMRQRADVIGATLKIESISGKGVKVGCSWKIRR